MDFETNNLQTVRLLERKEQAIEDLWEIQQQYWGNRFIVVVVRTA